MQLKRTGESHQRRNNGKSEGSPRASRIYPHPLSGLGNKTGLHRLQRQNGFKFPCSIRTAVFIFHSTLIRARLTLAIGAGVAFIMAARSATVEDYNTWIQYSMTGPLGPSREGTNPWRYTFDSPQRFGDNSRRYSQRIWRGGIGYAVTPHWSVWAGYGHSDTDMPYSRVPYGENRLFQQVLWSGRRAAFSISSRHRLEERFPETGHDMGLRSRHQFRVSHPVRPIVALTVIVSEEIFFNLNPTDYGARRGVDQNRFFAGFGWQWTKALRTEAGYINHYSFRPGREDRLNHVLALNLALAFK